MKIRNGVVFYMEKENYIDNNDSFFKRKGNKERLEISSTGYGLESVTYGTAEEQNIQETNKSNPSCGGL